MQSIKTPIFSKALLKLALSCSLLVSFVSVTYSQAANAQNIALEYNFLLNGSSLGHIQTRIQGKKAVAVLKRLSPMTGKIER